MASTRSAAIRRLTRVSGIGTALATKLVQRGVTTKAQLRRVADELPRETRAHLKYKVDQEIPLKVGQSIAKAFDKYVTFGGAGKKRRRYPILVVGSIRRNKPISKDVDLLAVVPNNVPLTGLLASAQLDDPSGGFEIVEAYASGVRRRSFIVRGAAGPSTPAYYAVDLFLATQREKPFALFHYTNGRSYNIRIRAYAKRKGYTLNQYGLFVGQGTTRKRAPGTGSITTERELTQYLGVTYYTPQQRSTA